MARKNKKTKKLPQEKLLNEIQRVARKQQTPPAIKTSQIRQENPYRGSNLFSYRQQMAANAQSCRLISEKINIIQVIIRYLIAISRPYLSFSDSETEAGFKIQHVDKDKKLNETEHNEIKQLQNFILNCGQDTSISEDDLHSYVAKLIRDYISIDYFTGQVLYSLTNQVLGFCSVDSATIVPLQPGDKERTKFDFVQIIENMEFSMFQAKEIIFSVGNPHNNINDLRLPGTPIVLTAATLLFAHIAAETHNSDRFKKDHLPRFMMLLQNASGIEDVIELGNWFTEIISGEGQGMPWKVPIIPSMHKDSKIEFVDLKQSNRDMEFSQLYEIGMSIISALFQIDLTELGIHSAHSGRIENNQQLGRYIQSHNRSLATVLAFIEKHLNQILSLVTNEYRLVFTGKKQIDSQKQQAEEKHELSTHSSINEIRNKKDLKPWGKDSDPLWNIPNNPDIRAFLQQSDHYLTINEQREQLGLEPFKTDWANTVPVNLASQAYQAEKQAEKQAEPEGDPMPITEKQPQQAEPQPLQDLTETAEIQKSLNKTPNTWTFRQLEILDEQYINQIKVTVDNIYQTLEHALALPSANQAKIEIQKSLENDFLIWKGQIIYDPESGRPVKKKDFEKLLAAIKLYTEKYAVNPQELVLTAEIIGRIIGRAYINGADYETLAKLEFGKDKVQYRGYNFTDISPDLANIRKIAKLSDKELVRVEYAIENAAHLLQKASDELIQDVRKIITGATVQRSSKRKTAETLRMRLGEYNRDWLKIANTETVDAQNNGMVAEIAANTPEGEPVLLKRWEMYDPAVCNVCKRFNKKIVMFVDGERDSDIAPKDSPADYLIWYGKNNYGRKQAEWWLSIGTVHPNCRGSWILYTKRDQKNKDLFSSWEEIRKLKTKLWRQAEKQANAPVTMSDGTTRRGKGNVGTVYSQLLQQAKAEGKL